MRTTPFSRSQISAASNWSPAVGQLHSQNNYKSTQTTSTNWSKIHEHQFSRATAMLKHVIDIGWTSVHPSVTRWHCIKTAERIVMLSSPHDSPFILVLCISRSSRNSDGVTPCRAAEQRWGLQISQFSTNNWLYLRNG